MEKQKKDFMELSVFWGHLFEFGFSSGAYKFLIDHKAKGSYSQTIPSLFKKPYHPQENKSLKNFLSFQQILDLQIFDKNILPGYGDSEKIKFLQGVFTMAHVKGYDALDNYFRANNLLDEKHYVKKKISIKYFQINITNVFDEDNKKYQNNKNNKEYQTIFAQLVDKKFLDGQVKSNSTEAKNYTKRGEFLNADFLLIIDKKASPKMAWLNIDNIPNFVRHYVVFDLSNFCLLYNHNMVDLDIEQGEHRAYSQVIEDSRKIFYQLKSKSVWNNLKIDFLNHANFVSLLNSQRQLIPYFCYHDKEAGKFIQAGSYLYSFLQYLEKNGKSIASQPDTQNFLSIYGISNVGQTGFTIKLEKDNYKDIKNFLQEMFNVYQNKEIKKESDKQTAKQIANKDIANKFEFLFSINFPDFKKNKTKFKAKLKDTTKQNQILSVSDHIEIPDAHRLCLNLRKQHTKKIIDFFQTSDRILILSGNPGIGKTFSLFNAIKPETLFFYCSPRLIVNASAQQDFINKLQPVSNIAKSDNVTDNTMEQKIRIRQQNRYSIVSNRSLSNSEQVLCYCLKESKLFPKIIDYSNKIKDLNNKLKDKKIDYEKYRKNILLESEKFGFLSTNDNYKDLLLPYQMLNCELGGDKAGLLSSQTYGNTGVLENLCRKINLFAEQDIFVDGLLAGFSMQAVRNLNGQNSSFNHIKALFGYIKGAGINYQNGSLINLRNKFKNIVFMIDEITGVENGALLFNEVKKFFFENSDSKELKNFFDIKLVAADASIVNPDIINKYLEIKDDDPVIYYERKEIPEEEKFKESEGIKVYPYDTEKEKGKFINVNSFPAPEIDIVYKYLINYIRKKYYDNKVKNKENNKDLILENNLKLKIKLIIKLIKDHIESQLSRSQKRIILLFLQNKSMLQIIQAKLKERCPNINSLVLDSNHSKNKEVKHARENNFTDQYGAVYDVILMTSTATRGITIQNVDEYIFDIPTFSIEQNLMEIVQGVYRGRGNKEIEGDYDEKVKRVCGGEKKKIIFLLSSSIYETDDKLSLEDQYTKLLSNIYANTILIKGCLLTRIFGKFVLNTVKQVGSDFKNKKIATVFVPIGGKKDISQASETPYEKLTTAKRNFVQEINKNYNIDPSSNSPINYILHNMDTVFPGTTILQEHHDIFENYLKYLLEYRYKHLIFDFFTNKSTVLLDFYTREQAYCTVTGNMQCVNIQTKNQKCKLEMFN